MKRLIGFLAVVGILSGFGYRAMAPYIPAAPSVKVHVARGVANCVVLWTDTTTTVIRTEIRRRGIIADTAVTHGAADTAWSVRGFVKNSGLINPAWFTEPCTFGRTYRYQVRDSIATVAFSGWSDSTSILVPTRKF